jgi:hypothetical protein
MQMHAGNLVFATRWLPRLTVVGQGLTLAALLLAPAPAPARQELHLDYQPVVPGLDYAHVQMTNWHKPEPWSIHIARLDRSRRDLRLVATQAKNQAFGIAPISAQAKSVPEAVGLPLAAINTGFCVLKKGPYKGAPRGVLIREGQLISPPFKYCFWTDEDGGMAYGEVKPKLTAALSGGRTFPIGLNHECKPKQVVLYTRALGKCTGATNHLELVLEDPAHTPLVWRAGHSYSLRVKAVNAAGNTALSANSAVLCFGQRAAEKAGQAAPGDEVKLELATEPDLGKAVTASEGIFPLLRHGEVLREFDGTKYLLQKHPRTATGFSPRYFYMVVVDGRQKGLSMGMYPQELARFMALLGCTEAMNLDGGGSSTFWLQGKVRNSPSDKRERYRSDGLAIVRRAVQ